MLKRERDIEDMVARAGLEMLNFAKNGAHYQVTLRAPNGETRRFAMARTPSDVRGDLNQQAELNRWARENPAPATALSLAMKTAKDPGMPKLPATPKKETEMTPTKNAPLSRIEFYKACEWLKAAQLEERPMTLGQLSLVAGTALGFPVPEKDLSQCLEAIGIRLLPPSVKAKEAMRCMARELQALMKELGKEPSKELTALAQEATLIELQ